MTDSKATTSSILDGFEVIEMPKKAPDATTKYAELFDKAVGIGPGLCLAKQYDSKREAAYRTATLRECLKRWARRNERWRNIEVFYRDATLYVHAKGDDDDR